MRATENQQTFRAGDAPETDDRPEPSASPQPTDHKGGFVLPWHRLFGLMLQDHLGPRGFNVALEVELSLKRQYVDVVVVEAADQTPDASQVCDGFENLASHNLITYKSGHESVTTWVLEELIGHYVNYRKILESRNTHPRLIRLYAVSTRFPRNLFNRMPVCQVKPGVYDFQVLSHQVRILVVSELPLNQRNAVLAFFSFNKGKVKFALEHYQWQLSEIPHLINQLLEKYMLEGLNMPYTMEDFRREYTLAHLSELPVEEVLSRYAPEDRLRGLPVDDRLRGLPVEEVLSRYCPKERVKGLPADEILSLLDSKEIEAFLRKGKKVNIHARHEATVTKHEPQI